MFIKCCYFIKMKIPFLTLIVLLWAQFAQAQIPKEEIQNSREELPRYGKWEKSFEFKEGEQIIFSFETTTGRKINRVRVIEPDGSVMNMTARKQRAVDRRRIYVYKPGMYTFQFRSRSPLPNSFLIRVERVFRTIDKDTLELEDVVISSRIDSLPNSQLDTVVIPDLGLHEFYLTPLLDIDKRSDSCVVEELLDTEYQYAAYWIGIGEDAKQRYDEIKNNPPPLWSLYQINEPVVAYGLKLTEKLPMSKNTLSKDVVFRFRSPEKNDMDLKQTDKRSPMYGFIPLDKAGKYKKIRLCIKNFNTTTGVPVYIRIAKFKIDKDNKPKYIVRERVQEIYIKRSYQQIDRTED